jgi:hypothetical protein
MSYYTCATISFNIGRFVFEESALLLINMYGYVRCTSVIPVRLCSYICPPHRRGDQGDVFEEV